MLKTKSAGGIVLNHHHDILVVNQKHLSWSLPKGHVDPGESDLEAAKREIYEETGVNTLTLVETLGSYSRFRMDKNGKDEKEEHKTMIFFLFTTSQHELNPIDPDNPIAKWVHRNEVAKHLTHHKDQRFFEEQLPKIEAFINKDKTIHDKLHRN